VTSNQLITIISQIKIGSEILGTIRGKSYSFGGIQKYKPRGRYSYLDGTEVVVLHSNERKNARIILFLEPLLLLVNATESKLSHGHLPSSYIEAYRSGDTQGIPNIYEYESHYKSLARYIKKLIRPSSDQG